MSEKGRRCEVLEMSQSLLTSNLNADFTNGYSKQNNGESNYSANYPLNKNWDSYRLKSGANYEDEIQYGFTECGLTVIKQNDTSFPAYPNQHGVDLVFINPLTGNPVVTECTNPSAKMNDKDMQEKISLNENEKQHYQTDESLLIISSMDFLSKKMRLLASQSYTYIIQTGWLKLPNLKVWRQNKRTWVREQVFREDLQRQLTKHFQPEKYRLNPAYQKVEQEEREETAINSEYKPFMEKEAAAIYKLRFQIKKLLPSYKETEYTRQLLTNSLTGQIRHWCNNKWKYQRLTEIKKTLKTLLNKLTNQIKPLKPTENKIDNSEKENDDKNHGKEEKKWVSHNPKTPYTLSQRKFPCRMKRTNKRQSSMSREEWGNLTADRCTYKMTEAEVHNMYVMYYQKDREEEIREEIETLKEFGFSREEISAMFRRC